VPGVIDVFVDPEKPKEFFCIGMEDLNVSGFESCDQIVGMKWQDAMLMADYVGKFHANFWQSPILKHPVVCSGEPEKCQIWVEGWGRGIQDAPEMVDIVYATLNPPGGAF
jgi:hypothetical protein